MDAYEEIVKKIIKEQEAIIGPLALEQARKVSGLKIDWDKQKVEFEGDRKEILQHLVEQYEHLFGRASIEVCREAAKDFIKNIPPDSIPSLIA